MNIPVNNRKPCRHRANRLEYGLHFFEERLGMADTRILIAC